MKFVGNIAICGLLLVLIGCRDTNDQNKDPTLSKKNLISIIQLKDLEGKLVDLNRFKGQTVFINFWATWCKPCLAEMPSIAKAQALLADKNVVFLMASDETVDDIHSFEERNKYKFQYVQIVNPAEIGIQALPTTLIFDPKGNLIFSEAGYKAWDQKENLDLITKTNK